MDPEEHLPIGDAEYNAILMHRDVHFGGSFETMLEYYEMKGKGAIFDIGPIEYLANLQRHQQEDLAPLLLSVPEMERVASALALYEELRAVYEDDEAEERSQAISDLILAEEEEEEEAVERIVAVGEEAVDALLHLLTSERFCDPLFPGYGFAPSLAARCLGRIGDPGALPYLFEAINDESPDLEEEATLAFHHIGAPAKRFLLGILQGDRISNDTEKAAFLASLFVPDAELEGACRKLLSRPEVQHHPTLLSYLEMATLPE